MNDRTIRFTPDDEDMEAAIRETKSSIRQFFEALLEPSDDQHSFLLKVVCEGDEPEHVWVADVRLEEKAIRGVVANEPSIPSVSFKQEISFEPSRITDWMFVQDGKLVGGYTMRLIRDRMSTEEREAFDASVPYRF